MSSGPADELDLKAIGTALVLARKQAGRDQTAVAAAVGSHQATLSRIERGVETNVSARLLDRIAREHGYALKLVRVDEVGGSRPAELSVVAS